MATTAAVAIRQDSVARLYLRGRSISRIASELGISFGTAKRDVQAVRSDLLAGHAEDLHLARARVMASVRDVLEEVWTRYDALLTVPAGGRDERALATYLNTVLKAQALLAKLAGVGAPPNFVQQQVVNLGLSHYAESVERRQRVAEIEERYVDLLRDDDEDADGEEDGADDEHPSDARRQLGMVLSQRTHDHGDQSHSLPHPMPDALLPQRPW